MGSPDAGELDSSAGVRFRMGKAFMDEDPCALQEGVTGMQMIVGVTQLFTEASGQ
jgi:hypothetical protein